MITDVLNVGIVLVVGNRKRDNRLRSCSQLNAPLIEHLEGTVVRGHNSVNFGRHGLLTVIISNGNSCLVTCSCSLILVAGIGRTCAKNKSKAGNRCGYDIANTAGV